MLSLFSIVYVYQIPPDESWDEDGGSDSGYHSQHGAPMVYIAESFDNKDVLEPHFAFQRLHAAIESNMGPGKENVHGWVVYMVPAPHDVLDGESTNPFPGSSPHCDAEFVPDFSKVEIAMGIFYQEGLDKSNHIGILRPNWKKTKMPLPPLLHAFGSRVMDLQAAASSGRSIDWMETAPRENMAKIFRTMSDRTSTCKVDEYSGVPAYDMRFNTFGQTWRTKVSGDPLHTEVQSDKATIDLKSVPQKGLRDIWTAVENGFGPKGEHREELLWKLLMESRQPLIAV